MYPQPLHLIYILGPTTNRDVELGTMTVCHWLCTGL